MSEPAAPSRDAQIREILALPDHERAKAYWDFARKEYEELGGDVQSFDQMVPKP